MEFNYFSLEFQFQKLHCINLVYEIIIVNLRIKHISFCLKLKDKYLSCKNLHSKLT